MPHSDILRYEIMADGILYLTLNDEKHRNALSEAMLHALTNAIDGAGIDPNVRVIILTSVGPAFCAGHNLKEMTKARADQDGGKDYFAQIMSLCATMMQSIINCPKPVIAEVAGVATAAGCQLVASCDLAIAAETAKFSTPGVHIGLFCSTPMVALSRNVSHKHAMEMLLTGDMVSAKRAAEIGLINESVSAEKLKSATLNMARKIASKSSMTLATGKRAFYAQAEMPLREAYHYASNIMVENMLTHDAEEGIDAFIEKRQAQWQDQ